MATSITHFGATWTFSENRQTGTFLNGEPWVVGPVTVTAITPNNEGNQWTDAELLAWRGENGERAWIPTLDYAPNEAGPDELLPKQGWIANPQTRTLGVAGFVRLWPVGKSHVEYSVDNRVYTEAEAPYILNYGNKNSGSMIIERPNRLQGLYPSRLYELGNTDFQLGGSAPTSDWQYYVNPAGRPSTGQGWANPEAKYYEPNLDKSLTANLGFVLSAGQILITAISTPMTSPVAQTGSPVVYINAHPFSKEVIKAHVALTVITTAEAAGAPTSFRPGLYNYDADTLTTPPRTIAYSQSNMSFGFLKNITMPGGLESIHTQGTIEANLPALPWWEFANNYWQTGWGGLLNFSNFGATGNVLGTTYGYETGHKWANTITWLNLRHNSDDAQNNAIKRKALIQTIQCSLDMLSFIKAGGKIAESGGGHKGGRKLASFTAGQALNDAALLQIAGRKDVFAEGLHTHIVRQTHLNDKSFTDVDRYTIDELGIADWNTAGYRAGACSRRFGWTAYQVFWNEYVNVSVLIADFLGMHAIWNDPVNFAYMERLWEMGYGPANTYVQQVATSVSPSGNFKTPRFYIGRKIVTNKATVVRGLPDGGSSTSLLVADKIGTIIAGPAIVGTAKWWQIRYKNGATLTTQLTGWSPETDITKMLQKAFTNTLTGGIFEAGKQLTITAPKADASVYYSIALPVQSISYTGDWPSTTQTVTIVSPGHGIPLGSTVDALLSGIQNTFQEYGYDPISNTLNGTTQTLSVINANTLTFPASYLRSGITVTNGKFLPYPADYDIDGAPIISGAAKIGTTSYSLPTGDTTFSAAVVREGYDMSNIVSSTFRIDSSGVPVQPSQSRGVASATQPEPALIFGPTSTLTQYGITWTFLSDLTLGQYGQFANGDWWVIGPVTITATSPAAAVVDGDQQTNGTVINPPWMINAPGYDPNYSGTASQGWDSRIRGTRYVPSLNIGNQLPYSVPIGSSVCTAKCFPVDVRPTDSNGQQMDTVAILTVLESPPPAGSFRPPYIGGVDKSVRWNKSQLDYSRLRRLPVVPNTPTFASVESNYEKTHIALGPSWESDYISPVSHDDPGYGRAIGHKAAAAALLLNHDYPDAQKERLLVNFVQRGIDIYGVMACGGYWWANGPHNVGRKMPMIMAGWVLNDSLILSKANSGFSEDGQHFYVSQSDVDLQRVIQDQNRPQAPYTVEMIGTPEWSSNYVGDPAAAGSNWDVYYRYTGSSVIGSILATRLMGAKDAWNHPATFDYYDRYWANETFENDSIPPFIGVGGGVNNIQYFVADMWDAYRHTYTLTQYGITWTFEDELLPGQYGQFVNGDWWVVGPVVITNISPKTVVDGDPINGTMLNPIPMEIQGLCNRGPGELPVYAPDKNISLHLPYEIAAGNSVYSTMDNPDAWADTYPGQLEKTYFKETAVLTVLSAAPPEGSFRPPYAGTDKTIKANWKESSMNYGVLRNLTPPIEANVPDREWMEDATSRPLLELNRSYLNSNWKASWAETKPGGYPRRTYGREVAHISAGAGLYLQTDASDATKRQLLINMCQWGIDVYGLLGSGMQWQAAGGHQHGRLLPLYIAAKVLGDAEMLAKCRGTTVAERTAFQEFGQHWIVEQSDVDTPRFYPFALPYTTEMIGMAEWSSNGIWERDQANADFNDLDYRWLCGAPNIGMVATALLMGGRAEIAAEPLFRYIIERHYPATKDSAQNTLPEYGDIPTLFTRDMWDAYVNIDTGLPPGLILNSGTGVISGTPTTAGQYLITLTATNATGTDTSPLTITISPVGPGENSGSASWSYRAWTNDETSGITGTSVYTAAVNLGGDAITVNGVPFEAGTGRTNFSIGGNVSTISDVTNVTGASGILAGSFIYGGNPRTITLTGLTPGVRYETSLFSTGWEAAGREQVFTAGINTLTLDQDAYGANNGICIQYTFGASATTQQLTITPVTGNTFHLAALANRRV